MTFQTQGAADLHHLIQRLNAAHLRRDIKSAHATLATINCQLKIIDDTIVAAAGISQTALTLHDTIAAIQNGEILVATGADPDLALTLDDLKEN